MQINKALILIFILSLAFSSCVEEYMLKLDNYTNNLVVEGLLTNESNSCKVKISRTSSLNSYESKPVIDAKVILKDNLGNEVELKQTENGTYSIENSSFKGIIGREYQLWIQESDKEYQSSFCQLKEPIEIKEIDYEVEPQNSDNPSNLSQGFRFFANSDEANSDSCFLFWKIIETYEYNSQFPIDYIYYKDSLYLQEFPVNIALFTCWRTVELPNFYFSEVIKHNGQTNAKHVPLHMVDNMSEKLAVKYSALIKQYHIDAESYLFLQKIEDQNSSNENLYSTQPFQVTGNIKNSNDPNEKVLGNFMVASVTEKRSFVSMPIPFQLYYPQCTLDVDAMSALKTLPPPVYIYSDEVLGKGTAAPSCFDCTLKGGTTIKPDFWKD
jgi:hypothetical protein